MMSFVRQFGRHCHYNYYCPAISSPRSCFNKVSRRLAKVSFSSRSTTSTRFLSSTTNNDTTTDKPPVLCDVIQGPSLLRTPTARPNPSLLYLPGLRSLPFWTAPDYSRIAYGDKMLQYVIEYLELHASTMRQEYVNVAPNIPSDYNNIDHNPTALHQGINDWKWHTYLSKGNVQGSFAWQFPKTAKILQQLRDDGLIFEGTPFGFSFFSTLSGGSTIAAHTAPMNLRLRIHLPLIVPETTTTTTNNNNNNEMDDNHSMKEQQQQQQQRHPDCGIRVGPMIRPWITDKAIVFDDSYDHEVWNHTTETRVLLLVDVWHPDISPIEKQEIVQLFQTARQEGMWKR